MPETPVISLANLEPLADLLFKVVGKIHAARLHQIYLRLALAVSAMLGSFGFFFQQRSVVTNEVTQSSFFQFIRLLWSDSDIALANTQDLALGLLETIPVVSILLTLISVLALLLIVSLASAWRHERRLILTNSVA